MREKRFESKSIQELREILDSLYASKADFADIEVCENILEIKELELLRSLI